MADPFFSLAKGRRYAPLVHERGGVSIEVEAAPGFGMATVWDADVLIWAARSLLAEARNRPRRLRTPVRGIGAVAHDHGADHAVRGLEAAGRDSPGFHRIEDWTAPGGGAGLEIVLAERLRRAVAGSCRVLDLDPAYFTLTGGIERWLYRLVRTHGGNRAQGWRFGLQTLHSKSGSRARCTDFSVALRRIVRRQALPGYAPRRRAFRPVAGRAPRRWFSPSAPRRWPRGWGGRDCAACPGPARPATHRSR